MSSKTTKKATNTVPKVPEPIVTRTKSALQKRVLRKDNKKTEKSKLTKQDIKSPKTYKNVKRSKEALLKIPKESVEVIDQAEYYPHKLKRNISAKKIMLKPKHNFKVVATTNKRKMATPQKGVKSPSPSKKPLSRSLLKTAKRARTRACSSPELSMQDMVRIIEETRSLSDEDFMEILTCPSPVWWEDPPDGQYDEDSIITISPEPKETGKKCEIKLSRYPSPINTNKNLANKFEQTTEQINVKKDKFDKKKVKLENVLGNIKNKAIKKTDEINRNVFKNNDFDRSRKLSDSEGDISDLSFNEEEILKNLENMEIPVEKPKDTGTKCVEVKKENDTDYKSMKEEFTMDNENAIKKENLEILPSLIPKPEIKEELSENSSVVNVDSDASLEINSNLKISDNTDIVGSFTKSEIGITSDSKSFLEANGNNIVNEQNSQNKKSNTDKNDCFPIKKNNDMSEYITIYKIIPEKNKDDISHTELKSTEDNNIKIDTSNGTLNDFFKQCKNKNRFKKNETSIPAVSVTAVKEATDKEESIIKIEKDEKNRLKCEYCVQKTENGTTDFSCEKCEITPILPCNLCNFVADSKEVYKNHVSSCKDVARISWSHNYVLNQT